jgi:hypothetical protein
VSLLRSKGKNKGFSTGERNAAKPGGISRRDFGRRVGWAAAAAAVFPSSLLGSLSEDDAIPHVTIAQASRELSSQSRLRVENQLRSILDRYPGRFRREDVTELRRILIGIERTLVKVRAFPLQNGDPSANVLKLYAGREPVKALLPPVRVHKEA